MGQATQQTLFLENCPRVKLGIKLFQQTWEEHIKPFHPVDDSHLELIKSIIANSDEQQSVWFKTKQPARMCIIKQVVNFLPENKFILIAFNKYSDVMACVTSIYPVDDLPSKAEGYSLL